MSEIPTPPLWRQRLDRVMQRLPADTPEWAKVMMDLTLELAVSQINHTDNNTRSAQIGRAHV